MTRVILIVSICALLFAINARAQTTGIIGGGVILPVSSASGNDLLLEDGSDYLLLEDGSSKLCLESGC